MTIGAAGENGGLETTMKRLKRCYNVLNHTGTLKMFTSFLVFYCISSVILWLAEPNITTIGDGFWYSYVAATTIGFGDLYAVTRIGRLVTVLVSVYCIIVTAMIPGVVVSYYMEYLKIREKETISLFLERLEHLPELSPDELVELSERVKNFNKKNS